MQLYEGSGLLMLCLMARGPHAEDPACGLVPDTFGSARSDSSAGNDGTVTKKIPFHKSSSISIENKTSHQ